MTCPERWMRRNPCRRRVVAAFNADVMVAVKTAKTTIPSEHYEHGDQHAGYFPHSQRMGSAVFTRRDVTVSDRRHRRHHVIQRRHDVQVKIPNEKRDEDRVEQQRRLRRPPARSAPFAAATREGCEARRSSARASYTVARGAAASGHVSFKCTIGPKTTTRESASSSPARIVSDRLRSSSP